ncbi:MAG: hypothetical protein LAO06_18415 [Acidobacteriia bacterium]|nr:hypothetical protein [Terriglobia bacterium]
MSARKIIIDIFDVAGGIAGACMILGGVLLLVSAPGSMNKVLQVVSALALISFGLVLAIRRRFKRTRIVLGAMFIVFLVVSYLAAVFLPIDLHNQSRWLR